jgi:hypothetical protein
MATFAKIGLNNKVIEVLSVHNNELLDSNGVEQEVNGIDFLTKLTGWSIWVKTWILNEDTCQWEAPVAYPDDDNSFSYNWNEATTTWDLTSI